MLGLQARQWVVADQSFSHGIIQQARERNEGAYNGISFKAFVAGLNAFQRERLYDELVKVLHEDEPAEEGDDVDRRALLIWL